MPPPPPPSSLLSSLDLTTLTTLYETYIHPLLPAPIQAIILPIITTITALTNTLATCLAAASNGDMVSLLAFLAILYFSLRIADYIRRSVFGWIWFFVKVGLVFGLINAVVWVNRYGVERAWGEVEWILGMVWDYVGGNNGNTGDAYGGYGGGMFQGGRGFHGGNNNAQAGGRAQAPFGKGRNQNRWS
ncbi:hypothetical protein HRR83_007668 [Exophiala dermatitidis]|uniref:Nuclear pore assembly and biogenesis-domain-containing protein n=1 Tax=Exophiala dermatitidis TaxID=5970 RepID=A0AAN6EP04_EXODE|nr:hypothetical protein HRR73_008963 [Exophiala dermatitidis]KAJ4507804.1 hypothetical protein HRR75_006514 [Exophiala dermatitidis]KAJ4509943.1 hypothetical protein HRR74_007095 [Exophiala dermatitidis]KAJ4539501.1 hypothetical protein HRR77_006384 [Exophiala dermatitidis]KAJ4542719.1 hypothetical protein HRR78_006808 [Exophiala dermatitidis]